MSFGLSFKQLLRLVAMLVSQVLFLWVAATWATPLSFTEADSEAMSDQALAEAYLRQQQGATTTPYAAAQQLYFEERRTAKRGPPTPGFSSTGLTTPLGSEPTAPAPEEASGSQATPPAQGFVQAFQVQDDVALQLTAAQAGVNPQDTGALRTWLGGTVTTRATVLETIRHYHKAVIRPELYNLVTQVEQALIRVDDRVLRQQADLDWMCSENRTTQKQASGLQVLLSGFPADFTPQERFYMINWLLEQITVAQHFLTARGYPAEGELRFLNCLQSDPSTPPAGEGRWSAITILSFKSWDLRSAFMEAHGGATGIPLYRDERTPIRGHHIRATPSSPQFQRKLELPIRVILHVLNNVDDAQSNQVVILWKTLTVMSPQTVRAFDAQITACARLFYYESNREFKARLEFTQALGEYLRSTPPARLQTTEPTMWQYSWNAVTFGTQLQIDAAEKQLFVHSAQEAKGTGKGLRVGKGARHWTAPMVYSSETNPYPIDLEMVQVSQVAFVWDEYCDKFKQAQHKVGDYKQATYQGAPATPQAQDMAVDTPDS